MTISLPSARRHLAAAALALAVALAMLAPAAPAHAATPEILVSDDGITFDTTLDTNLFDGLGLLVPEETIDTSLWVRNPGSVDGSLRLSVTELTSASPLFLESVTLTAVSGGDSWSWTLAELAICDTVIPTMTIGAGETVRVDLTAAMGNVSGTTAQDATAELDLGVTVRDDDAPFPSDPCTDLLPFEPEDGGGLAFTGADVARSLGVSIALIFSGLLIVAWRRRRDREGRA